MSSPCASAGSDPGLPVANRGVSLLPPLTDQLDLVESTYRAVAAGKVELPPKPGIHPRKDSFIHAMPAYLRDDDVAALEKWVAGYPENKARGLPYISGLILVNDAETGLPAAIMDAAEITARERRPRAASASASGRRSGGAGSPSSAAESRAAITRGSSGASIPRRGSARTTPSRACGRARGPRGGGGFSCRGRQGRRRGGDRGPNRRGSTRRSGRTGSATSGSRCRSTSTSMSPGIRSRRPTSSSSTTSNSSSTTTRWATSATGPKPGSSARSTTEDPGSLLQPRGRCARRGVRGARSSRAPPRSVGTELTL